MTMHEMVTEFMKKHDQAMPQVFAIPDPGIVLLRVRLIVEEHAELMIGLHENDTIKIMDACADLRYVVVGTAIAYGFPTLDHFGPAEPGTLALPAYQAGAWTKIIYFNRLNKCVSDLINMASRSVDMLSFVELQEIHRQMRKLTDEVLREITYLDAMYSIPAKAVFAEVHRSNMTKAKLDKNSKGGKVTKKGFDKPNFAQFLHPVQ